MNIGNIYIYLYIN